MPIKPILDAHAVRERMAEKSPPYSPQEALTEASRCLFCFDAPCIMACPTGIDIPTFIRKISTGNNQGAAKTILSSNILGASCARVCPTSELCEGACVVLTREGDPVKIGRLQRHATDFAQEHGLKLLTPSKEKKALRVAVIGAGPAGLACAAELALQGASATVFERKPLGGGLNTYGIAYYKMKPEVSVSEVEMIRDLGVDFRYETEVGRDVSPESLLQDYDAVFLGVGLGEGRKLGIPGENLPDVVDAIEFIEWIHKMPLDEVPVGQHVIVLGGGNTAIDAVTQARRLGAEVATIVYRRDAAAMGAYEFEQEFALQDGARFLFGAVPVAIEGDERGVTGLRIAQTVVRNGRLEVFPGSERVEPCDMIIKAVGQKKQGDIAKKWFPDLAIDADGRIVHDPITHQTNLPKIYVGGDCANGGREVVNAVAEGKKAAQAILGKAFPVIQPSRLGAPKPYGSGFENPVRVKELQTTSS